MIQVLDASVAVKWLIREGEDGLAAADDVRSRVLADPDKFAVPALFFYEVHAAFCRRVRRPEDVKENMRLLWAFSIRSVQLDDALVSLATELAFQHRVTAYDAAYLAVARHLGGVWLTFDEPAYRRAKGSGVVQLLKTD